MLIIATVDKSSPFPAPRPPSQYQAFPKEMDIELRDQAEALTFKELPGTISALTTFTYIILFTNRNGPGGNRVKKGNMDNYLDNSSQVSNIASKTDLSDPNSYLDSPFHSIYVDTTVNPSRSSAVP